MEDNAVQQKAQRMEEDIEHGFIPGLPNDIVKEHISTKIPWSAMLALTQVNREWRRAIRSREIHDLRKRCGATKSTVVIPVSNTTSNGFYDVESRGTYLFRFPPPAPDAQKEYTDAEYDAWEAAGMPYDFPPREIRTSEHAYTIQGFVFLDEKLYTIRKSGGCSYGMYMEDILMLDVGACEREWKICSRWEMCATSCNWSRGRSTSVTNHPSELLVACNGKIYSFHSCNKAFHGRVFDPQSNEWREIEERPVNVCHPDHPARRRAFDYYPKELRLNEFAHRTGVFNKEIFVGWTWGDEMMIFDSVTEKWRLVPNTLITGMDRDEAGLNRFNMLVINEKLYNISQLCLYMIDNLITGIFHSQLSMSTSSWADVAAVVCYGNELLALLDSERDYALDQDTDYGIKEPTRRFCKSVGFGVEGQTLTWEDVTDFPFKNCFYHTAGFQLGCLGL